MSSGESILLTVEQAAEAYNIGINHMYDLINQGVIRPVKFGPRGTRIYRGELERVARELTAARADNSGGGPTAAPGKTCTCHLSPQGSNQRGGRRKL